MLIHPSRVSRKLGAAFTALSLVLVGTSNGQTSGTTPEGFNWYSDGNGGVEIDSYSGPGGAVTFPAYINGLPVTSLFIVYNTTITSAVLPATLTTAGGFIGCNIKQVTCANGPTSVGGFDQCNSLTAVTLPETVTNITDNAFYYTALTSITIPESVKSIGINAFGYCYNLQNICFQGNRPSEPTGRAFSSSGPAKTIYYKNGATGWGSTFDDIPTLACSQCVGVATPPIQTGSIFQPPTLPTTLRRNLMLLIHGWSGSSPTPISDSSEMPALKIAIENRLAQDGVANDWDVDFWNWSDPTAQYTSATGWLHPQVAARNAGNLGDILGPALASSQWTNIVVIAHSAGAWMANKIGQDLTAARPDITTKVVFLDPYTPSKTAVLGAGYSKYSPEQLGLGMPFAEQYYYEANWFGTGVNQYLVNADNYDVSAIQKCCGDTKISDWHGWPIRYYTDTAKNKTWYNGYQNLTHRTSPKGDGITHIDCPPVAAPAQTQEITSPVNTMQKSSLVFASPHLILPPPPPLPEDVATFHHTASRQLNTSAALSAYSEPGSNGSEPLAGTNSPAIEQPQSFGSDFSLTNLVVMAQGGDGSVSLNTNGVQLTTTNFIWETLNFNATNGITFGTVDYTMSAPCNSVLGMYVDGNPIQYIESATNNPLNSYEIFPISPALGTGNHNLTVSLESLDGAPISATLNSAGFYYIVEQPLISSAAVINGSFGVTWEAGAGLKYQTQRSSDLTSTNWTNVGGLLTSPTNAMMSMFNLMSTNKQRFYRLSLQQ